MPQILKGKPLAQQVLSNLSETISHHELHPGMLLIQVGSDPASEFYVQNIIKTGTKLGCNVDLRSLAPETTQDELLALVEEANHAPNIHGIMIQRPLPRQISEEVINEAINPGKDIDAMNPINLGRIILETDGMLPCTPTAVFLMLQYYGIPTEGKNIAIIGRSAVVGKPLANIMLWKSPHANATVTVCHSKTPSVAEVTRKADIVISAIGKAGFVRSSMLSGLPTLIDVGINEVTDADGKSTYVGDADYADCLDHVSAITPVPGGVGTVTTAVLYINLIKSALRQKGINKKIDDFIAVNFNAK